MFVVFEGPDGSGKTSIAYKTARLTDAFLVNCGAPPLGKAKRVWDEIVEFSAHRSTADVVFDRLHWGDYPYGTLFRKSELGLQGVVDFDKMITAAGGLIVYVRAEASVCINRVIKRGGEISKYEDPDKQHAICAMYDQIALASKRAGNRVLTIDNSQDRTPEHANSWANTLASHVAAIMDDARPVAALGTGK